VLFLLIYLLNNLNKSVLFSFSICCFQPLGSLKKMNLRNSNNLKEIPDLSLATNLEELDLCNCEVLESFPSPLNSESLKFLNLLLCPRLRNFPEIIMQSFIFTDEIEIEVADCLWNKNLPGLDYLDCLRRCNPSKFRPEHLKNLTVRGNNMLEKLWEGVQVRFIRVLYTKLCLVLDYNTKQI